MEEDAHQREEQKAMDDEQNVQLNEKICELENDRDTVNATGVTQLESHN